MNYYYITGTSSGIGKAIASQLLLNDFNRVIGISRKKNISHPNYQHISIDLSDIKLVSAFNFSEHLDAEKVVLINNAGMLGEVAHVGNIQSSGIHESYTVDVIAPSILCNLFINRYKESSAQKIILNISSGAGKYPIDGWGVYCASKAALDMFSLVIAEEQRLIANPQKRVKVFSVAPGKVDTPMQAEIRRSAQNDFSKVQFFIDAKNKGELLSVEIVAKQYIKVLEQTEKLTETVFSLEKK